MLNSVPFAVTSKCVMRSEADPGAIIANDGPGDDDSAEESTQTAGELRESAAAYTSTLVISEGRAESGWIFRDEAEESLFSQQSEHSCSRKIKEKLKQSSGQADDSSVVKPSPETSVGPVSRRQPLSAYHLPHPSKLRSKAGAKGKRCRESELDHPVERHVQQLKKKKVAYFSKESVAGRPTTEACSAMATIQADGVKDILQPLEPAAPDKPAVNDIASVPAIAVPVAEDEDEHWFKEHWKSQQHTTRRPVEE